MLFFLKKITKIVQWYHRDFALALRTPFFQGFELANTGCVTSIHFKSINYLQCFAVLSDNNIIVAMYYSKAMITCKKFCEEESFNQLKRFVFEKLLKRWGSITSEC